VDASAGDDGDVEFEAGDAVVAGGGVAGVAGGGEK
jgi:hypothetical protein